MADRLRLAVGIMGNAATLSLFASPILTFARVIRKRSTEEFSCIPYIFALLNCLLYTWYGLPIVSCRWENFPLVTVNGLGIIFEICFILIYFHFTSAKGKIKVAVPAVSVILVFCIIAIISALKFTEHHSRKVFVGSIGVVASAAMYSSPLVVMQQVIRTKSVESMPLYLSLFSFLSSSLWLAYGTLSRDIFVASPNVVGCPMSILQLVLYCKYRKGRVMEETNKWDLEQNDQEQPKQVQLIIGNNNK